MEIASAFVTIRPEVSGFEAELASAVGGVPDQEVTLTADADTSAAEDAVESVPDGEVEITANTEQAEQGIDQVREKVEETTSSTNRLGDAAAEALGGMGNLGGASGAAAGALGSTAVAGAAAAAGLFTFAQAGVEAAGASQRFDLIAGSMADDLASIDVGGLSGDIGDLALQLGSSDEAMLNATASFVTFAESTGASSDQIVEASNNINALALRAVALNPGLGDAGAAAERMVTAFQRGGRALVPFGLGLSSAEINARAMADTGKVNVAELTAFEKAAAGAALATERLGQSMGQDFTEGAQNAQTQWARMTEQLGEAQEAIGGQMLPAVENITEAVTQMASGLANMSPRDWLSGLWDLSGGLIVNGLFDLRDAIVGVNEVTAGRMEISDDVIAALGGETEATRAAVAEQEALSDAVANTLPSLGGIIAQADAAGEAFGIMNASSDPQVIIDNLSLALFAWDDFQNNINTVREWGPRIAGALQQLGPEVAGGLTDALANGNALVITQLDALIAEIEARGGDAAAVLTGFAQNGMSGAVAAVEGAAGPMGAAGQASGAAGASGIDAGLAFSNASGIGQIVGVQYGAGVSTGVSSMAGTVAAVANSVFAGASISGAFSAGQALGSSYGSGIVAGLASQIGNVTATRISLDNAAELGAAIGRSTTASTAPARVTLVTNLDGRVVAERVFEIDRQMAIAEGYEQ